MITINQVLEAKKNYEAVREQFHKESSTTIRIKAAPDAYRGDMCCIEILDKVEYNKISGDGAPNILEVKKNIGSDTIVMGTVKQWFGNNGKGRLASEEFIPAPGVTVLQEND